MHMSVPQAAHDDGLSECVYMHAASVYASQEEAGQDYAYLTLKEHA